MNNFEQLAIKQLNHLSAKLEDTIDDAEIDLVGGVLYITLPDNRQYVINKHSPTSQIWVSSPVSGASYFSFDVNNHIWVNTHGQELAELLSAELGSI